MQGSTYAVPKPIGCRRQTNTTRPDGKREDLADDNPGRRAPSGSEEGDVQADKCNHGTDSRGIVLVRLSSSGTDDPNNELHNDHASSAVDEDSSSTKSLNDPKCDWRRANVNERSNQTDQEWILD